MTSVKYCLNSSTIKWIITSLSWCLVVALSLSKSQQVEAGTNVIYEDAYPNWTFQKDFKKIPLDVEVLRLIGKDFSSAFDGTQYLSQFSNLTVVYLVNDMIEDLPSNTFRGPPLKLISLGFNGLKMFPNFHPQKRYLTNLYMRANLISVITESHCCGYKRLGSLQLTHNIITDVTPLACLNKTLEDLGVAYNKISYVGNFFNILPKLSRLSLAGNNLSSPFAFGKQPFSKTALIYLNLGSSQIRFIPALTGIMTTLEELIVSDNQLYNVKLPRASSLKVLDISDNPNMRAYPILPKPQSTALEYLDASNCALAIPIPETTFTGQIYLSTLIMNRNPFRRVPQIITYNGTNNIANLSLSAIQLRALNAADLEIYSSLRVLDLSDNFITDIEPLVILAESLEALDVGCNRLQLIPEGFVTDMGNLLSLNLSYNSITLLNQPPEYLELSLRGLAIHCNCCWHWLWQLMEEYRTLAAQNVTTGFLVETGAATCSAPVALEGRLLSELNMTELFCASGGEMLNNPAGCLMTTTADQTTLPTTPITTQTSNDVSGANATTVAIAPTHLQSTNFKHDVTSSTLLPLTSPSWPQQVTDSGFFPEFEMKWNNWMTWTDCTQSCNGGSRFRFRICKNKTRCSRHLTTASGFMIGYSIDISVCHPEQCPVDGFWTRWGQWTACSATCGEGIIRRERQCLSPVQNGDGCDGRASHADHCNIAECPVRKLSMVLPKEAQLFTEADERPSAQFLAGTAVILLSLCIGLLFVLDLPTICRPFLVHRGKCKGNT